MHMTRVQVSFTDDEAAALRERSRESGRPITAIVREAVRGWLGDAERRTRIDRALGAIGGFHSGLTDFAENHDEYFVQAIEERIGRR